MRIELFLLLIVSISFSLIDPPVMEVYYHDISIAPTSVLHYNALNLTIHNATIENPTTFFYLKILTLTPSVNGSISPKIHPYLIWLVAEDHKRTVTVDVASGSCYRYHQERDFGDLLLVNVSAYYTVNGLIHRIGNETIFDTANATQILADNTSFYGSALVPFQEKADVCGLIQEGGNFLLGGMINFDCYGPYLDRASPYGVGTVNFTSRNVTIVEPHLNVSLKGNFAIGYTDRWSESAPDSKGNCETYSGYGNGTIYISDSDFASYEIQNDYTVLIPYSPRFLNLSADTPQDVSYTMSILSDSDLYKYYSRIDNESASALYLQTFDIASDSYGTQVITAKASKSTGFLPQDNNSFNAYSGRNEIEIALEGMHLLSPQEVDNLSYNFSRVYQLKDTFFNLTPGPHHVDLLFYTYWGNYSVGSDIYSRYQTDLSLGALAYGNETVVICTLNSINGTLVAQPVTLRINNETHTVLTSINGSCAAVFESNVELSQVYGNFAGSSDYLPSTAIVLISNGIKASTTGDFIDNNIFLLLILSSICIISFSGASNILIKGRKGLYDMFMCPQKSQPSKKQIVQLKNRDELATSLIAAYAGGGADVATKARYEAIKKAAKAQKMETRKPMTNSANYEEKRKELAKRMDAAREDAYRSKKNR